MILLTGAAGFIGSNLLQYLNKYSNEEIIIVDDFNGSKLSNLTDKEYTYRIHRDQLFDWLKINKVKITQVFHLGARTDTTEKNNQIFHYLNLNYSKQIWQYCVLNNLPLVYASSAATYGMGEWGFEDSHFLCEKLIPLNPYAVSKNDFDKWALQQKDQPPFWAGLKFFNVYGPNEYHKGRMASVIFHAYHQILNTGKVKLFRSHRKDIQDGFQARDFIYVKDIVKLCWFFINQQPENGLYNAGTGRARTFLDLAKNTFKAMGKPVNIEFIETPIDIRATYQYFTEATMTKTFKTGYGQKEPLYTLEEGIEEYVKQFLIVNKT